LGKARERLVIAGIGLSAAQEQSFCPGARCPGKVEWDSELTRCNFWFN